MLLIVPIIVYILITVVLIKNQKYLITIYFSLSLHIFNLMFLCLAINEVLKWKSGMTYRTIIR